MTNEKEWKPMPEREDAWITDYAFEATVEATDDEESHDYTVRVVELQNVHKIVAEATRRGEAKAWEEASTMLRDVKQRFRCAACDGASNLSHTLTCSAFAEIDAKLTSLKTP